MRPCLLKAGGRVALIDLSLFMCGPLIMPHYALHPVRHFYAERRRHSLFVHSATHGREFRHNWRIMYTALKLCGNITIRNCHKMGIYRAQTSKVKVTCSARRCLFIGTVQLFKKKRYYKVKSSTQIPNGTRTSDCQYVWPFCRAMHVMLARYCYRRSSVCLSVKLMYREHRLDVAYRFISLLHICVQRW